MKHPHNRRLAWLGLLIGTLILLACNLPLSGEQTSDVTVTTAPTTSTPTPNITITPSASQEITPNPDALRSLQESIHPNLPDYVLMLIGEPADQPDRFATVRAIRTWQLGRPETLQTLDGFVAYPVLDDGWDAFIIEDLNFDGYRDLRLMADMPAGPNIPYVYWLFDPQAQRFARNQALEQITAPEIDAANQQIISNWRNGAATFGTDTWRWENGALALVRQEVVEYIDENRYTLTIRERVGGELTITEQREVDESAPDDPFTIRFAPGATSAVVENTVQGDEVHPYRLRAMAGQMMLLHIEPLGQGPETWVEVQTGGATLPPLAGEGGSLWRTWLGRLPQTGEYTLSVRSVGPPSTYRLTVVIKTPAPQEVRFASGAIQGSVAGTLNGVDVQTYQLRALAGQQMRLTPVPGDLIVAVVGADGLIFDRFLYPRDEPWAGQLPRTQDYMLVVTGQGETRDYTLDVEITSPLPADLLDACPEGTDTQLWHINASGGFCFLYPAGFAILSLDDATELRGPFRDASLEPLVARLQVQNLGPAAGKTAEAMANEIIAEIGGRLDGTLTLGGEQAVLLADVPGRLPSRRAIVVHDDVGYGILAHPDNAGGHVGEDVALLWNTTIATFTFTP